MSVDVEGLRRLAEAATPGLWTTGNDDRTCVLSERRVYLAECDVAAIPAREMSANAAFIAAANPQTVLALLDALAAVTAARDEACMLLSKLIDSQERHSPAAVASSNEFKAMKREIDRRIASLRKVGAR